MAGTLRSTRALFKVRLLLKMLLQVQVHNTSSGLSCYEIFLVFKLSVVLISV